MVFFFISKCAEYRREFSLYNFSSGNVPELIFEHFGKTGQRLFGRDSRYSFTRVDTPVDSMVATVGNFDEDEQGGDDGLHVSYWAKDDAFSDLYAAPIVVPAHVK